VVDVDYFRGFKLIQIPEDELYTNNMLYLGKRECYCQKVIQELRKIRKKASNR